MKGWLGKPSQQTNLLDRRSIDRRSYLRSTMSSITHDEIISSKGLLSGPVESRDLPDWFREQQAAAFEKFESIPRPTRKDQPWRFSNVDLLDLAPFKVSPALSDDDRANVLKYS